MTQTQSLDGKHNVANLCSLDGDQIWIMSGPLLVYFQEPSRLYVDQRAQQIVFHPHLSVKSIRGQQSVCFPAQEEQSIHVCFCVWDYFGSPV